MHDQRASTDGADELVDGSVQESIPRRFIEFDGRNRVRGTIQIGDLASLDDGTKGPRLRRRRSRLAKSNCPGVLCHSPTGTAALSNVDAGRAAAALAMRQDRCTDEATAHDAAVSEEVGSTLDDNLAPASARQVDLEVEGSCFAERTEREPEWHGSAPRG